MRSGGKQRVSLPWWVETKGGTQTTDRALSIAEVKRSVSMGRLLQHYGGPAWLTTGGAWSSEWASIPCPFHTDRKPSASYSYRLQRFRCHTCDIGGDVLDVVEAVEHLTTKEALQWIRANLL